MSTPKAKILLYDLETSANVAHVWGHYEQNVLSYVKEWDILSVAWKWLGEAGKAKVKTRADFRDKSDGSLVTHLHRLLGKAHVVIGHNSIEFDNKKSFARFAFHGLPPLHFQNVDTLREARKAFKFNSNKLDDLGKHLGLGEKMKTGGFSLWEGAMAGDRAALKKMGEYNRRDVDLLEKVYLKLRPFMKTHPNVALIGRGEKQDCPNCGSDNHRSNGNRFTQVGIYQQRECQDCKCVFKCPKVQVAA